MPWRHIIAVRKWVNVNTPPHPTPPHFCGPVKDPLAKTCQNRDHLRSHWKRLDLHINGLMFWCSYVSVWLKQHNYIRIRATRVRWKVNGKPGYIYNPSRCCERVAFFFFRFSCFISNSFHFYPAARWGFLSIFCNAIASFRTTSPLASLVWQNARKHVR